MFDIGIFKAIVLAVLALVIFGPDQLPKVAAQAGRAIRQLRTLASGATKDLREGLGPEFADFDINDLNPRKFVQKHLFDDLEEEFRDDEPEQAPRSPLDPAERPPFDIDAT